MTREERYFCAELFYVIREDVGRFVRFLNEEPLGCGKQLDESSNWQAAYEVCFYRDLKKHNEKHEETLGCASDKRTFDLALFSDSEIVLVEAKAQQSFETKQLENLKRDREDVKKVPDVERVYAVALISSKYCPKVETRCYFDRIVTWQDLAREYRAPSHANRAFERANCIYPRLRRRRRTAAVVGASSP